MSNTVLVCGGRRYGKLAAHLQLIDEWIATLKAKGYTRLVHGGARGADRLAGEAAGNLGLDVVVFSADWDKHGKAAGPIRNQRMIDEATPSLVVAFPGGTGTADMVRRAKAAGIEVVEVSDDQSP